MVRQTTYTFWLDSKDVLEKSPALFYNCADPDAQFNTTLKPEEKRRSKDRRGGWSSYREKSSATRLDLPAGEAPHLACHRSHTQVMKCFHAAVSSHQQVVSRPQPQYYLRSSFRRNREVRFGLSV